MAEACQGVLSQEAHLFSNEEKDYLGHTLDLPCKFVQNETHLPPTVVLHTALFSVWNANNLM